MSKSIAELIRKIEAQGGHVEQNRRGHYKVVPLNGTRLIYLASTPGGARSHENAVSALRRGGFSI